MRRTLLLIGASSGIGLHLVKGLADSFNLALHYNTSPGKVEKLISEMDKTDSKIISYKADITNEKEVNSMVEKIKNDFDSIDVLINNAGVTIDGMTWKLSLESWQKVMDVNLTGPFLCIKHVLPVMRDNNWGRIINISSVVASTGVPGTVAYAVSKSGLHGLTKTVSKEIAKYNITANIISLGYFDTGMLYTIGEEIREQIKQTIPQKEFGNPNEIVSCVKYLTSDNSKYITGQVIHINGGLF